MSRREARTATIEAMREVAIPDPAVASTIIHINSRAACGNAL
jgi:hypothetical protein